EPRFLPSPPHRSKLLVGFRKKLITATSIDSFCSFHHTRCDGESQETWLLHRDLLHALVMPVVELFARASALAEAALCTHKSVDLELAFAGEARSAFL